MNQNYWKQNSQIIIREISMGKIWTSRPVTVIQDSEDLLVFYMTPGTVFKHPRELDSDNVPTHLIADDWRLIDKTWFGGHALYLSKPGQPYMVIGFMDDTSTEFQRWYINLQDPLIRTDVGFDYLDMELDIEVGKDLSEWHWKDEEKFNRLIEKNIIPEDKAEHLRVAGKEFANEILTRRSMVEEWIHWHPPLNNTIPSIPSNWDKT